MEAVLSVIMLWVGLIFYTNVMFTIQHSYLSFITTLAGEKPSFLLVLLHCYWESTYEVPSSTSVCTLVSI